MIEKKVKMGKKIDMGYNQILDIVKVSDKRFLDCGNRKRSGRMILNHFDFIEIQHRQRQFHQAQALVQLMKLSLLDKKNIFLVKTYDEGKSDDDNQDNI